MATSTDSSVASPSIKASRFSTTLKALKFSASKPPPPPPKDGNYYNLKSNRSFISLASESPFSPMNRSAASLLSSRSFSPPEPVPPLPVQPQKKRQFFSFGKKSSKPSVGPPTEDEGISLPWNFSVSRCVCLLLLFCLCTVQHNIHVDEGYISCVLFI